MFASSRFNKDISKWNVSNVKSMDSIFVNSKFNSDISKWNIDEKCLTLGMFNRCPIKEQYKPKFK